MKQRQAVTVCFITIEGCKQQRRVSPMKHFSGESLSYVHGACDVPLIGETIGDLFDRVTEKVPDNEALGA